MASGTGASGTQPDYLTQLALQVGRLTELYGDYAIRVLPFQLAELREIRVLLAIQAGQPYVFPPLPEVRSPT